MVSGGCRSFLLVTTVGTADIEELVYLVRLNDAVGVTILKLTLTVTEELDRVDFGSIS